MPIFSIDEDVCMGMSHSGGITQDGEGYVELTDEDVENLISLMRRKNSIEVDELELKDTYPEIYKKLDLAYYEMTANAEEEHWLEWGYHNSECHNFESSDMIEFLKSKDAWHFEYDENDFLDEDGEVDEDELSEAENEYMYEAMDKYFYSVSGDELKNFLKDIVGIDVDLTFVEYEVKIPQEIIDMAFDDNEE